MYAWVVLLHTVLGISLPHTMLLALLLPLAFVLVYTLVLLPPPPAASAGSAQRTLLLRSVPQCAREEADELLANN